MYHSALGRLGATLIGLSVLNTVLQAAPPLPFTLQKGEWVSVFNGRDLTGWTPKIRHAELGDNYGNTFRVVDGILQVRYDQYTDFQERFGHLFLAGEYDHYRIRVEYRFVDSQAPGGPGWAVRNSGVMVHGELPATMAKEQDFPASIEVQLLGGLGKDPRTTANLCTPGTNVEMEGKLIERHCTNSISKTYHGDQWITVEIEVRGNQVIRHWVEGQDVLHYQRPQLDPRDAHSRALAEQAGTVQLERGTISLQSESHPIDFRRIELMLLDESQVTN